MLLPLHSLDRFWCFKRLVRSAHPTKMVGRGTLSQSLSVPLIPPNKIRTVDVKITENDFKSALPDLTTTMRLPDLGAAVEVYRDRWGSTE